jgi:hypothetical protein
MEALAAAGSGFVQTLTVAAACSPEIRPITTA